jgi:hypothetical protein
VEFCRSYQPEYALAYQAVMANSIAVDYFLVKRH